MADSWEGDGQPAFQELQQQSCLLYKKMEELIGQYGKTLETTVQAFSQAEASAKSAIRNSGR